MAEVQGRRNQLFRDYHKFFDCYEDAFDLSEVLEQETLGIVNTGLRKVMKTTLFFYPFEGQAVLSYPWNSLSRSQSKVLYEILFCNAGLGNRAPVNNIQQMYECMSCAMVGKIGQRMNEKHLLLECQREDL